MDTTMVTCKSCGKRIEDAEIINPEKKIRFFVIHVKKQTGVKRNR